MINLTENITINANHITTINENYTTNYKNLIEKTIITKEDMIYFTTNDEEGVLCKPPNIILPDIGKFFIIQDHVGGEDDTKIIHEIDIKEIKIFRL